MIKRFAALVLVLLVVGGDAFSQAKPGGVAREIALGGSNLGSGIVVNPFIFDDPSRILLNPAQQGKYKDYIWMNIGGGGLSGLTTANNGYGQQSAGVSFSLGKEFTIGTVLSFDPSAVNLMGTLLHGGSFGLGLPALPAYVPNTFRGAGVTGAQTVPAVQNVWEVLAAYDMGTVDLGFGFMYGTSNADTKNNPAPNTSSEIEASARMLGFRAGAIVDMGSGSAFEVNGAIRMDKAVDNVKQSPVVPNEGGEYSASGTEIQLGARLKMRMSNKVNFIPYAGVSFMSAEPKEDSPLNGQQPRKDTEKMSTFGLAFGAGAEYHTSTFLLAGGLSFQSLRLKAEFSDPTPASGTATFTYTAIPVFNIGTEYWLTDWLAGRAGYYRSLGTLTSKQENTAGTVSSSSETNQTMPNSFILIGGMVPPANDGLITLGLGMKFGSFALDATVSEEALRRGLGLIGAQDNINTFGFMTASFNFE